MMLIVFMIALIVGCLLGYQIGVDKRLFLEIEIKHLTAARDNALENSRFWQKMYQRQQEIEAEAAAKPEDEPKG